MPQIADETLITLREALLLPWMPRRGGKPMRYGTLRSWTLHGVQGIKLEHVMAGTTPCTSELALRRFFARLTGPETVAEVAKTRRKEFERAEAALDAAGVK